MQDPLLQDHVLQDVLLQHPLLQARCGRMPAAGCMNMIEPLQVLLEKYLGLRKGMLANTVLASLITSANTVLCTAPVDFLRTQVLTLSDTLFRCMHAHLVRCSHGTDVMIPGTDNAQ